MNAVAAHTRAPVATVPPAGPARDGELAEISQISVHLAALERTVLPVAAAKIYDSQGEVGDLRRRGRELADALYWLERHLTGDARAVRWPERELSDAARVAAASHARSERAVVDALKPALSDREIAELSRSYHQAALAAPTRPHPSLSFRGFAGRIAFRVAAFIDATRDGLDNRSADDIRAGAARAVRQLDMAGANPSSWVLRLPAAVAARGPVPAHS